MVLYGTDLYSAIFKENANLYLQVGGGIVHESQEKAEYQETLDKAKSFMSILKTR